MAPIGLHKVGSFQTGQRIWSETPLEDLWRFIALIGRDDYLSKVYTPEDKDAASIIAYAAPRIRQAVEFRNAAHVGTALTAPLPLYYSFLNLTRGVLAISKDSVPTESRHGLTFMKGETVTQCRARVARGTFSELLSAMAGAPHLGETISLEDCLAYMPEIGRPYSNIRQQSSRAVPVRVRSVISGPTTLDFRDEWVDGVDHFRTHWQEEFPTLAAWCTRGPEGATLSAHGASPDDTVINVEDFCAKHLEPHVGPTMGPVWYALRKSPSSVLLPREAYYVSAVYILGSVARYLPEKLLDALSPSSSEGWLLEDALRVSERCYPNLLLNWAMGGMFMFGPR